MLKILLAICVYCLALVCECYFLWPYVHVIDFAQFFPQVCWHLMAALLFSSSVSLFLKQYKGFFSWHVFSVAAIGAFCFSLFLMLGFPLFLGGAKFLIPPKKSTFLQDEVDDREVEESMSQLLQILPQEQLEEEISEAVHESLDVESYSDILKGTESDLKKGALDQLSRIKTKESIALIKQVLKDSDPELRYYASLKLKKIEDEFHEQIVVFKEKVKHEKTQEARNHLADTYSQFCSLGILDASTLDYYYKLALNEYILSLEHNPKQPYVLKNMARNYFAIGRPDQALTILERALLFDSNDVELHIMVCEAHSALGQWEDVQKEVQFLRSQKHVIAEHKELLEYWGQDQIL